MKTLEKFTKHIESVPLSTTWLLTELGEYRGMQELFKRQSPQVLKALKDFAIIESAVSSNRIEGVEVDKDRIRSVVLGKGAVKDRNEEEVRGYKNALNHIFGAPEELKINRKNILLLHKTIRGDAWDSCKFKNVDSDIIETYPDGRSRIRFKTISADKTPEYVNKLIEYWKNIIKEKNIPQLLSIAAFNLDFLCVHPFRDGNGRVSRLLFLLQLIQLGFDVGKYISMERIIEENKERYYETLEESSKNWHKGNHDPWPYINYMLFIVKSAYREFESRARSVKEPRGKKRELVIKTISKQIGRFSLSDIQHDCPSVSTDMIRKVMKELQKDKKIKCVIGGQNARWEKLKSFN